jgi:hypothetical protein
MWSIRRNWKEYVNKYVLYSLNCICSLPVKKKKGFLFMSVKVSSVIFGVIALYYSFHLLYLELLPFITVFICYILELLPFITVIIFYIWSYCPLLQ